MFDTLLEYFKTLQNYNDVVEYNIMILTEHFKSETPRMNHTFEKINQKYDYKRYAELVHDPSLDTHLEFWRGSGQFNLEVCLASLNGVYHPDADFGTFYDLDELCNWRKFKEYQNDEQEYLFLELSDNLFYTWLAYIWQSFNKNLGGFPVKILENNTSTVFNLVDFAWFDNSQYHGFLDKPIRRKSFFNRELSINELYSKVQIPYQYDVVNCSRKLEKEGEIIELKISKTQIELSFADSDQNEVVNLVESSGYKKFPIYVKRHNELLNDGWHDITYTKEADSRQQ